MAQQHKRKQSGTGRTFLFHKLVRFFRRNGNKTTTTTSQLGRCLDFVKLKGYQSARDASTFPPFFFSFLMTSIHPRDPFRAETKRITCCDGNRSARRRPNRRNNRNLKERRLSSRPVVTISRICLLANDDGPNGVALSVAISAGSSRVRLTDPLKSSIKTEQPTGKIKSGEKNARGEGYLTPRPTAADDLSRPVCDEAVTHQANGNAHETFDRKSNPSKPRTSADVKDMDVPAAHGTRPHSIPLDTAIQFRRVLFECNTDARSGGTAQLHPHKAGAGQQSRDCAAG